MRVSTNPGISGEEGNKKWYIYVILNEICSIQYAVKMHRKIMDASTNQTRARKRNQKSLLL